MVMQREVICWLQSLDLTHQVRHPQQDLSNGFTLAEIASRHDQRVAMHSYVPGCSSECKRRNWKVLLRDLRRIGCNAVTAEMAEGTMQGKPGVALHVLEVIYAHFCGRPIPPLTTTENVKSPMALLLNKLDVARSSKKMEEVSLQEQKNIPLSLKMGSDGNSFIKELQQPGFARPTATALLHVANSDARNAMLVAAVPGDELQIQMRNEKLLNERKVFNRAYKHAEPGRFAVSPCRKTKTQAKKPALKSLSGRGGKVARESEVTVEKVSLVTVNSVNKELVSAIRAQGGSGNKAKPRNAEELHDSEIRELLDACDNNLCLGLSKVLSSALESTDFKNDKRVEKLTNGDSPHDILSAFVGRREELPFAALCACWSALLDASGGIASAVVARPSEYMYLLQVFQFAFLADVVHIRMLHVSGPPKSGETLEEKDNNSASETLLGGCCFNQNIIGFKNKLQLIKNDSDELPQVLFLNERVYSVASVFSLFCSIGAALHEISPSLSLSLLKNCFLPTASRLFSSASAAILEAIARVVVSHVCGSAFNRRGKPTSRTSLEETEEQSQLKKEDDNDSVLIENQKEQYLRKMNLFLTGPIKKAFFHSGLTKTNSIVQLRFQYNLFLYHVLRHMRYVVGAVNAEKKYEEQTDDLSQLFLKTMTAATATVTTTTTTTTTTISSITNPLTPMDLSYGAIFTCLGSSFIHERSIGVAMLLQLLSWDRWDLVIDPLFFVVNDIKERGMSSGFLQRTADAWEIRVLLLKVLTIAFRKALFVLADNSEGRSFESKITTEESSFTEEDSSLEFVHLIKRKFDFNLIEDATVMCLVIFLDAPLLQRQVALQIVGATLLPDEQRRVAVLWLRCLFSFPVEQLDFLLCPYEKSRPFLEGGGRCTPAERQQRNYTRESTGTRSASPSRRRTRSKQEGNGSVMEAAEHATLLYLSNRASGSLNEIVSSVRVIFGRVEPAYIVAPLNQSWDTFGVVHAALMFEEVLTTTQMLSVILAALLSPQRGEMQRLGLLCSLHSVTYAGLSSRAPVNESSITMTLSPLVGELFEERVEKKSTVTLQELVGIWDNTDPTASGKVKEDVNTDGNGGQFSCHSSTTTGHVGNLEEEEEEEDEKKEEEKEEEEEGGAMSAEKEEKAEDGKKPNKTMEMMEFHEESFWLSVSRLLKAELRDCLATHKTPQVQRNGKSVSATLVSSDYPASTVCRIAKTEDPARLQLLATAVLLTLFCRVGPVLEQELPAGENFIQQAQRWLDNM